MINGCDSYVAGMEALRGGKGVDWGDTEPGAVGGG